MARFGSELFTKHLLSIEMAGALLLVALVGAISIMIQTRPVGGRRPRGPSMNEVNEAALLHNYLLIGGLLFAIGAVGFLVRRNLIVLFLCAEMMLQGISVSLVAWGRYCDDWGGQMLVLFIIAVAACEAAIAMTLILALARRSNQLDMVLWQDLREEGQPPYVDQEVPEQRSEPPVWPSLPPAGVQPPVDEQEQLYRSRV